MGHCYLKPPCDTFDRTEGLTAETDYHSHDPPFFDIVNIVIPASIIESVHLRIVSVLGMSNGLQSILYT